MTDKQKEILGKMLEGEVFPWLYTKNIVFQHNTGDGGLFHIISEKHKNWDDYNEAWKVYENLPLVKALR